MFQPEELKKDEPLFWSPGKGTDVWALFVAAMQGDLPAIRQLIQKDPSLIRSAYDYRTPLYFAVRENQLDAAALLLELGADPTNSGTPDTLLQIATDREYTALQGLLKKAVFGTAGDASEANVIAAAIRERDPAKVKQLLDAQPSMLHARDEHANQPIHWAVMTRQPGIIDDLLDRGADINAQRKDGAKPVQLCNGDYGFRGWRDVPKSVTATPDDIYRQLIARGAKPGICMAAFKGDINRVKELLEEDPSLANRNADYITYYVGSGSPLTNAAAGGHIDIVQLLLDRGADPNLPAEGIAPRGHALYTAVSNGRIDIAQLLLQHGANPSAPVESSADALSIAMWQNNKEMIELLCSYGAARSVNLLAYSGDIVTAAAVFDASPALANDAYALENAAGKGYEAFVRLMLHYQPDLAKRIAVGLRSRGPQDSIKGRALVEFLFSKGMNANHTNWLGQTPLHHFAKSGDTESAAIFIEHGANLNARDEELYTTALGYAAKFGKLEMVKLLLKNGASTRLPDDKSWSTPIALATRKGHQEIINVIQEHAES
jgi:ankyrin repeat protein